MMEQYKDRCEEKVYSDTGASLYTRLFGRDCENKRGLRIVVHPGGREYGVKTMCFTHSRKAFMSGWLVDWDESLRVFGTKPSKGKLRRGIGM